METSLKVQDRCLRPDEGGGETKEVVLAPNGTAARPSCKHSNNAPFMVEEPLKPWLK